MGTHDELLTWQRARRRREHEVAAPPIDAQSAFWASFLEATELLATFDEPRALELLTRADACCPQDADVRAALDETLGEAEFLLNDYALALEHLRRAQTTWAQRGERLRAAEAQAWLGACLVQQGRYQDGFEALHAAQRELEALDRRPRAARALNSLAVIHEELGDYHRAFEHYRDALQCAVADGDLEMQGRVLANHGEALVAWGAPEQGLPVLSQAVDVLRTVGAHWHYGWCLLAIGRIHHGRGDAGKALEFHEAALDAVEKGHSPRARVEVYTGLGELHSQEGRHVEAKRWLDRALLLATSLGIRREIFKTHKAFAEAHKRAGEFEVALRHHERFHEVRSAVFDELARERVATLRAEFELERVLEARERERREAAERYTQLEQRAVRDGLTGLFNRRHFEETLTAELQRARTSSRPLSLVLLDVDFFKRINDTYSHVVGDAVLRVIAQVLQRELRASDVPARYGGEEFAIVLPHTALDGARIAAEKVRVAIATSPWSHLTPGREVTASLGLAEWKDGETSLELLRRTDQALYAAKASGRNRVRHEVPTNSLSPRAGRGLG